MTPPDPSAPATADLCLGATAPKKVIHHRRCHHARADYGWARRFADLDDLAYELVVSGAWRWHDYCSLCAVDVSEAVALALEEARWEERVQHNHDAEQVGRG